VKPRNLLDGCRAGMATALFVLGLVACSTSGPLSPQQLASAAQSAAAAIAAEWGLAPGLPRESQLQSWLQDLYANPAIQTAAAGKPSKLQWEDWGKQMVSEGLPLLSDDELRAYLQAKSRLLSDATDVECAAAVNTFTDRASEQDRNVWRQRLARVSDADFERLNKTDFRAFVVRASRSSEVPYSQNEYSQEKALRAIVAAAEQIQSPAQTKGLLDAIQGMQMQQRPDAVTASMLCSFLRVMWMASAQATGPNAELAVRYFLRPAQR
jgi:hypothetical protein